MKKVCLWCGEPVPKGRRKYCDDWHGFYYWRKYLQPLLWINARYLALDRAGRACEKCGAVGDLEVHHIVPLERFEPRHNSPKNAQENLQVLCRPCHELTHHPKPCAKAMLGGQLAMELNV